MLNFCKEQQFKDKEGEENGRKTKGPEKNLAPYTNMFFKMMFTSSVIQVNSLGINVFLASTIHTIGVYEV